MNKILISFVFLFSLISCGGGKSNDSKTGLMPPSVPSIPEAKRLALLKHKFSYGSHLSPASESFNLISLQALTITKCTGCYLLVDDRIVEVSKLAEIYNSASEIILMGLDSKLEFDGSKIGTIDGPVIRDWFSQGSIFLAVDLAIFGANEVEIKNFEHVSVWASDYTKLKFENVVSLKMSGLPLLADIYQVTHKIKIDENICSVPAKQLIVPTMMAPLSYELTGSSSCFHFAGGTEVVSAEDFL